VGGGTGTNIVSASGVSSTNSLWFYGSSGSDTVTGGAGNDFFIYSATVLSGTDGDQRRRAAPTLC